MKWLAIFLFLHALALYFALAIATMETGTLRQDLREARESETAAWKQVQELRASIASGIKIEL